MQQKALSYCSIAQSAEQSPGWAEPLDARGHNVGEGCRASWRWGAAAEPGGELHYPRAVGIHCEGRYIAVVLPLKLVDTRGSGDAAQ